MDVQAMAMALNKRSVRVFFSCVTLLLLIISCYTFWPAIHPALHHEQIPQVTIVVASQSSDNTTWLDHAFLDWEKKIYITNTPSNLSVPAKKGREGMV